MKYIRRTFNTREMPSFSALFCVFIIFVNLKTIWTIRVNIDPVPKEAGNTTELRAISYPNDEKHRTINESIISDSGLSVPERNRRLIPYMEFYIPAPDLAADQKYLTLKHQKLGNEYPFGNIEEPYDSPSSIPIPTAYVHMKVPAAGTGGALFLRQRQQGRKNSPTTAGEVYRSISYGGQHPVPSNSAQIGDKGGTASAKRLISSMPSGRPAYITVPRIKYDFNTNQQQQQPIQQLPFRPSSKPLKQNFTPFTSSNKVPGDFIPIVYSPLSFVNNNEDNDARIHLKTPEAMQPPDVPSNRDYYHEYTLAQKLQPPEKEMHNQSGFHEIQIIPVTPNSEDEEIATAIHPTSSPIYQVINEQSSFPPTYTQNTFKPQQLDTGAGHFQQQTSNFDSHAANKFFQQELTSGEQYSTNTETITPPHPQYIAFLQQRQQHQHHHNHHQQHNERYRDRLNDHQQFYKPQKQQQQNNAEHHPHAQLLVRGFEARPLRPGFGELRIDTKKQQKKQQAKYTHAVYPQPKYTTPTINHQTTQRQYLPPPIRPSVSEDLSGQQLQQRPQLQIKKEYQKFVSESAPYIDYLIEEPKQSLDDEQTELYDFKSYNNHKQVLQTLPPEHLESTGQQFVSPPRPFYKNQTDIHLQSVLQNSKINYPTPQPAQPAVANHQPSISPQYIYVTSKPSGYSTPTTSNTFKSSYDFGDRIIQSSKRPTSSSLLVDTSPTEKHRKEYPDEPKHQQKQQQHQTELPDINSSSLAEILHKLQASNHLPQTLTPDNIDNSIKTLITILNNLKKSHRIGGNPSQHHTVSQPDYEYSTDSEEEQDEGHNLDLMVATEPTKRPGPDTGRPGIDYPNYADIPNTDFDCGKQRYKGFFGDPGTNCQVWHYCDLNGGKASFLCPNGTIFSQIALTCDWWFNVKCSTTSQLYVLNERLYKYILPFNPKFPEDFSGPIVDKYLALKFQEMEEKMRLKKLQQETTDIKIKAQTNQTDEIIQNMEITTNLPKTGGPAKPFKTEQVNEQSSQRNLLLDDEVSITQRDVVTERDASMNIYNKSKTDDSPTTKEIELPLSLKPIVVTLMTDSDYDKSSEEQQQSSSDSEAENGNELKDVRDVSASHERTRISVEKVEVIEIKSDNMPEGLVASTAFHNETQK